jgi:tripartite-type tricarboxylate transporter receptor subunit TctC
MSSSRESIGRRWLAHMVWAAVATAAIVAPMQSFAQGFPDHAITLIVPYAAGGQTDTMARILAAKLGERLKTVVVVENRGGATGSIAASVVARSRPDGYTLLFGSGGPMSIYPVLRKDMVNYDPIKDFTPVAYVANSPNIIAAAPSFPAKTVAELIAYAKAHPGQLNVGSTAGSDPDMMNESFRYKAGVNYERVPYPSGAPLLNDVLGGQVAVLMDGIIAIQPQVVTKKLVAIAVSSSQRLPSLPDVPTISETIPDFVSNSWFSVFAPAKTPIDIVAKLNTEINEVLALSEVKTSYLALGATVVGGPPERLRDHLAAQLAALQKLTQDTGLKWD